MKKSFTFSALVMAASLAFGGAAHAQLGGLGGLLGGGKSSASSNAGGDLSGQQTQLARHYVEAGKNVMTANDHFADALGIKAQIVNANTTADSLSASDIEAQDKAISANATAVSNAMKAGATLKDAESKQKYTQGMISLVSAIKKYKDMSSAAQGFSSGLSNASPMLLPQLQSGVYIVKSLPGSVSNLTTSLKSAMDFAKSNGVEVPADATSVL
jgi:hypothetical protein